MRNRVLVFYLLALFLVFLPAFAHGKASSLDSSAEGSPLIPPIQTFQGQAGPEEAILLYAQETPGMVPEPGTMEQEEVEETASDPLEGMNRAFFTFNDRMYFWALKPVASGYKFVIPQVVRVGVDRIFSNLNSPCQLVNCLLQAKFKGAGVVLARAAVNTTVGLGGFFDPAARYLKLKRRDEDFDQTLAIYGLGPGIYFDWPTFGPSSVRGSVGLLVDLGLNPLSYLFLLSGIAGYTVPVYKTINSTSLVIGEYEDFKKEALDPYVALRNAYFQSRASKASER